MPQNPQTSPLSFPIPTGPIVPTKEYLFYADSATYFKRQVHGHPGITEHNVFVPACYMPDFLPHGCNPRFQDINTKVAKKIAASFLDVKDMDFHLKNLGITCLASSVQVVATNDPYYVCVKARIPEHLGNVNGQHSYMIVTENKGQNPWQRINVRFFSGGIENDMPLVEKMSDGLNAVAAITDVWMGDMYHLYDPIKAALSGQPYFDWIKFKDNQPNVSANVKDLIQMMWVCHPTMFETGAKLPSWVFTRSASVVDGESGFLRDEKQRSKMLEMTALLPDLVKYLDFLNKEAIKHIPPKQRKSTSRVKDASGKGFQTSVLNLFEDAKGKDCYFKDPTSKTEMMQLRWPYALMLLSGLRALMRIDGTGTGYAEWKNPSSEVIEKVISGSLKRILNQIVLQLREDHNNHNQTQKRAVLWNTVADTMENTLLKLSEQAP